MKLSIRLTLVFMLFSLSGCFRQADDSFEPINNPTQQPIIVATEAELVVTVAESQLGLPVTATFPPVTIISPSTPISTPVLTEATKALVTISSDAQITSPETTPAGFITPGAPVGPIIIDTPTPFPDTSGPATPSGLVTPTAFLDSSGAPCTYSVRSGDNLYRIALNNNVSLDDLRRANPEVVNDLIQPGQVLRLPNCDVNAASSDITVVDSAPSVNPASSGQRIHTVSAGETLYVISQRYGVTIEVIVQANNLSNPNALSIGQQLIIP